MSVAPHPKKETKHLNHKSLECCGWLQLSGFQTNEKAGVMADVRLMTNTDNVVCEEDWSHAFEEETRFTLICVLIDDQVTVFEKDLLELGWTKVLKFLNPNTDNWCHQYAFIPEDCRDA